MKVQRNGREFTVEVTADGEGVVSHAGAALLAKTADRIGLTKALCEGLAPMRSRRGAHDPGRVVRDLAVMLASGGSHLSDLSAVRDQEPLFGTVASDATAWRTVEAIARDPKLMGGSITLASWRARTPGRRAQNPMGLSSSTSTRH